MLTPQNADQKALFQFQNPFLGLGNSPNFDTEEEQTVQTFMLI